MIINYLKKTLRLTAIVFTIIVLFQLLAKQNFNNSVLYDFLAFSFIAALIKVIFSKYFSSDHLILHHLLYLIVIWLLAIISNIIFEWQLSLASIFLTFFEIVLIYICVRFINFQHDKSDVKRMNEILNKNRENKVK